MYESGPIVPDLGPRDGYRTRPAAAVRRSACAMAAEVGAAASGPLARREPRSPGSGLRGSGGWIRNRGRDLGPRGRQHGRRRQKPRVSGQEDVGFGIEAAISGRAAKQHGACSGGDRREAITSVLWG